MKKILIVFILPIISFSLITCNSLNTNTATVTIDTGIRATKAAAPSDVTSISVTVTGSDMPDITGSISTSTGVGTFPVPVGSARLFSVTAIAGNFTYLGSATQDVVAGGPNDVSISMIKQVATLNITIPNQSEYAGTTQNFIVTVSIAETGGTEQGTFTPSSSITMAVPPGNNRQISVTATPLSQSAVVSFSTERARSNFTHGQTVNVTLSPIVTETKLVIPDYQNDRIVQIDDLSLPLTEPNWIEKNGEDLGLGVGFSLQPYDIDFDKYGRIYIARNAFGTGGGRIYRINTIQDSAIGIYTAGFDGLQTFTMDKNVDPHILYFSESSGSMIKRCTIDDCSSPTTLANTPTTFIRGIFYYNGLLLIAHADSFTSYDTSTENIINSLAFTGVSSSYAWDMIVKGSYIYGTFYDTGGYSNYVRRFTLDGSNNLVDTETTYETTLYGPHRFIDNLTNKIYFADDTAGNDQLVVIDDISGTGRDSYGTNGTGIGNFDFFE